MATATRKRARVAKVRKARKERSDKGIERAVTKLCTQAKRLRNDVAILLTYTIDQAGAADTRVSHDVRVLAESAGNLLAGLDRLDGRMKVLIDPSKKPVK